MRIKRLFLTISLFLLISCGGKEEVFKAPEKAKLLASTEVLKIGEGRPYRFISHFYVSYGNSCVFVGDPFAIRIDRYSVDGKLLLSMAGKGAGPGEFTFLPPFAADSKGTVVVSEYLKRELVFFSPKGRYSKSVRSPEGFQYLKFTPRDILLLVSDDPLHARKFYLFLPEQEQFIFLREDKNRILKKPSALPLPWFDPGIAGDDKGRIFIADS